eukprot:20372-Heterococcus_DN1.PRE.2
MAEVGVAECLLMSIMHRSYILDPSKHSLLCFAMLLLCCALQSLHQRSSASESAKTLRNKTASCSFMEVVLSHHIHSSMLCAASCHQAVPVLGNSNSSRIIHVFSSDSVGTQQSAFFKTTYAV